MIPHSKPTLGDEEKEACREVIKSLHLAQGERVARFEGDFCKWTGRRYAVAVSSGSAALHLSLRALGVKHGDEVIFPSFTCAALLHAVEAVRARPVPVDIDAEDFNISMDSVKKKLRRRTKAVIVPHAFGRAARIQELLSLGIPVLEDGTQALGAQAYGRKVGSFGPLSVFSFYATKMITTGEGGMIATDSAETAGELRDMRDYDKKARHRFRTNAKMTDLQAAIGIEQLKKLPFFIQRRRELASFYREALAGTDCLPPRQDGERDHVYYRFVVRWKRGARRRIRELNRAGIEAKRPVFKPIHQYLGLADRSFPAAREAYRRCVSLPIFPLMSDEDCREICRHLQHEFSTKGLP